MIRLYHLIIVGVVLIELVRAGRRPKPGASALHRRLKNSFVDRQPCVRIWPRGPCRPNLSHDHDLHELIRKKYRLMSQTWIDIVNLMPTPEYGMSQDQVWLKEQQRNLDDVQIMKLIESWLKLYKEFYELLVMGGRRLGDGSKQDLSRFFDAVQSLSAIAYRSKRALVGAVYHKRILPILQDRLQDVDILYEESATTPSDPAMKFRHRLGGGQSCRAIRVEYNGYRKSEPLRQRLAQAELLLTIHAEHDQLANVWAKLIKMLPPLHDLGQIPYRDWIKQRRLDVVLLRNVADRWLVQYEYVQVLIRAGTCTLSTKLEKQMRRFRRAVEMLRKRAGKSQLSVARACDRLKRTLFQSFPLMEFPSRRYKKLKSFK